MFPPQRARAGGRTLKAAPIGYHDGCSEDQGHPYKEAPRRSSFAHLNQPFSKERKLSPVGLTALMAGALRFIPLPSLAITLSLSMSSDPKHCYKGFVASSQRHGGVYSTLDAKYQVPQPLSDEHTSLPRNKTVGELYSK